MARKTSTATVDDDPIFVAITTYWVAEPHGPPVLIREGARHRASSGYPQRHSDLWLRDPATDAEIVAARQGRERAELQAAEARTPKPATDPDAGVSVYAVKRAAVPWIGGDGHPRTLVIEAGERYDKASPVVKRHPELFAEES
jgi:hypothetical protein